LGTAVADFLRTDPLSVTQPTVPNTEALRQSLNGKKTNTVVDSNSVF